MEPVIAPMPSVGGGCQIAGMAMLVRPPVVAPPRLPRTPTSALRPGVRRPRAPFVTRQAGLLAIAVSLYFAVRSLTAGSRELAESNASLVVDLERSLGLFRERDVQELALSFDGVLPVVNAIYIWGHWPVIAAVLGWLAWRHREEFLVYRNALLVSGLVGMVVVAFFPVAPPRLMDLGFLDTVTMESEAYRVLQPPSFTNQYAAMPSFHVGWDLLVGIALLRVGTRRWMRLAGATLPVVMLISVVVTGNHYFVDAIVGDLIVLASLRVALLTRAPTPVRVDVNQTSG